MAYRNTIISLASLVALGTACSKAPNYSSGVQAGDAVQQVASEDAAVKEDDHGLPAPENKPLAEEPKKEETVATTPAPPAANTPAAPAAPLTPEQKAKAIAEKGFVAYAVNAANGQGWNTSASPYLIGQTVNAGGAIDTAKPVTVYFCNFSAANMRLHSESGAGPMAHGATFAGVAAADVVAPANLPAKQAELDKLNLADIQGMANCRAHPVTALGTTVGKTYNHNGGNEGNAASHVFFKMYTVDAAGVVTAK